jgi:hypothetical protein
MSWRAATRNCFFSLQLRYRCNVAGILSVTHDDSHGSSYLVLSCRLYGVEVVWMFPYTTKYDFEKFILLLIYIWRAESVSASPWLDQCFRSIYCGLRVTSFADNDLYEGGNYAWVISLKASGCRAPVLSTPCERHLQNMHASWENQKMKGLPYITLGSVL